MTERRGVEPVYDGPENIIFTVGDKRGKDEARDFLLSLSVLNRARFDRHLRKLNSGIHIQSPQLMRFLSSDDPHGLGAQVHELKVHDGPGYRIYIVKYQGKWYLTHGGKKPKKNKVSTQISRAFDIFHADL